MRAVIEIADTLRRTQRRVVQVLIKGSEHTLLSNALEAAQAQGAHALIVIGAPGMDQDHVAYFEKLGGTDGRRNGRPHRPAMKKLTRAALLAGGRSRRRRKELK
jgi:hypothetical protein